ncbi:MAG: DUF948 domain-containing protein [bacterium]
MNKQKKIILGFVIIMTFSSANKTIAAELNSTVDLTYKDTKKDTQGITSSTNQITQDYNIRYDQVLNEEVSLLGNFRLNIDDQDNTNSANTHKLEPSFELNLKSDKKDLKVGYKDTMSKTESYEAVPANEQEAKEYYGDINLKFKIFPELRFRYNYNDETQDSVTTRETKKKEFVSQYTLINTFKFKFDYKDTLIDDKTEVNSDSEQDKMCFQTSFKHDLFQRKMKIDGDYKFEKENDKTYVNEDIISNKNEKITQTARSKIGYKLTNFTDLSTTYEYKLIKDKIAATNTSLNLIKGCIDRYFLKWLKLSDSFEYKKDELTSSTNNANDYLKMTYIYLGQIKGRPQDWLDLNAHYEKENTDEDYQDDINNKKTEKDSLEASWRTSFVKFLNSSTELDIKRVVEKENNLKKRKDEDLLCRLKIEPVKNLSFQSSYENNKANNYLTQPEKEVNTNMSLVTDLNLDVTTKLKLKLNNKIEKIITKNTEGDVTTSLTDKIIESNVGATLDLTSRIRLDLKYTHKITDCESDDTSKFQDLSYSINMDWTILSNLKSTSSFRYNDKGGGAYDDENIDTSLRYKFLKDWEASVKYSFSKVFSSPMQKENSISLQLRATF